MTDYHDHRRRPARGCAVKAQHTPGPWFNGGSEKDGDKTNWFISAPPNCIAVCPERDGSSEANARLIAAAPELLNVLIQAIEASGFQLSGPTDSRAAEAGEPKWVCDARSIIAEATKGAA